MTFGGHHPLTQLSLGAKDFLSETHQYIGESVPVIDPYPGMTLAYALKLLGREYGAENVVHWRVSDVIGIVLKYPGEDTSVTVTLTLEQAKYLAAHPLSVEDLVAERYPENWPMAVNNIYELTRDNIIAESVDADETVFDKSQHFNRGTVLTILRGPHSWRNIKELEYCTVEIGGKCFNIPALVLAKSIIHKR